MTFAWYGHLKYKSTPLWIAILLSWLIAFVEYCFQVPANRIGHGQFTAAQLKIIQEVITLLVFAVFSIFDRRKNSVGTTSLPSCASSQPFLSRSALPDRSLFRWGILLGLRTGCASVAAAQQEDSAGQSKGTVLFPRERIFPKFLADGTAEQFSLAKDAMTRNIIGSIGGIQRLVQFSHSSGTIVQIGLGATVYGSFVRSTGQLQVVTADFYVDVP